MKNLKKIGIASIALTLLAVISAVLRQPSTINKTISFDKDGTLKTNILDDSFDTKKEQTSSSLSESINTKKDTFLDGFFNGNLKNLNIFEYRREFDLSTFTSDVEESFRTTRQTSGGGTNIGFTTTREFVNANEDFLNITKAIGVEQTYASITLEDFEKVLVFAENITNENLNKFSLTTSSGQLILFQKGQTLNYQFSIASGNALVQIVDTVQGIIVVNFDKNNRRATFYEDIYIAGNGNGYDLTESHIRVGIFGLYGDTGFDTTKDIVGTEVQRYSRSTPDDEILYFKKELEGLKLITNAGELVVFDETGNKNDLVMEFVGEDVRVRNSNSSSLIFYFDTSKQRINFGTSVFLDENGITHDLQDNNIRFVFTLQQGPLGFNTVRINDPEYYTPSFQEFNALYQSAKKVIDQPYFQDGNDLRLIFENGNVLNVYQDNRMVSLKVRLDGNVIIFYNDLGGGIEHDLIMLLPHVSRIVFPRLEIYSSLYDFRNREIFFEFNYSPPPVEFVEITDEQIAMLNDFSLGSYSPFYFSLSTSNGEYVILDQTGDVNPVAFNKLGNGDFVLARTNNSVNVFYVDVSENRVIFTDFVQQDIRDGDIYHDFTETNITFNFSKPSTPLESYANITQEQYDLFASLNTFDVFKIDFSNVELAVKPNSDISFNVVGEKMIFSDSAKGDLFEVDGQALRINFLTNVYSKDGVDFDFTETNLTFNFIVEGDSKTIELTRSEFVYLANAAEESETNFYIEILDGLDGNVIETVYIIDNGDNDYQLYFNGFDYVDFKTYEDLVFIEVRADATFDFEITFLETTFDGFDLGNHFRLVYNFEDSDRHHVLTQKEYEDLSDLFLNETWTTFDWEIYDENYVLKEIVSIQKSDFAPYFDAHFIQDRLNFETTSSQLFFSLKNWGNETYLIDFIGNNVTYDGRTWKPGFDTNQDEQMYQRFVIDGQTYPTPTPTLSNVAPITQQDYDVINDWYLGNVVYDFVYLTLSNGDLDLTTLNVNKDVDGNFTFEDSVQGVLFSTVGLKIHFNTSTTFTFDSIVYDLSEENISFNLDSDTIVVENYANITKSEYDILSDFILNNIYNRFVIETSFGDLVIYESDEFVSNLSSTYDTMSGNYVVRDSVQGQLFQVDRDDLKITFNTNKTFTYNGKTYDLSEEVITFNFDGIEENVSVDTLLEEEYKALSNDLVSLTIEIISSIGGNVIQGPITIFENEAYVLNTLSLSNGQLVDSIQGTLFTFTSNEIEFSKGDIFTLDGTAFDFDNVVRFNITYTETQESESASSRLLSIIPIVLGLASNTGITIFYMYKKRLSK